MTLTPDNVKAVAIAKLKVAKERASLVTSQSPQNKVSHLNLVPAPIVEAPAPLTLKEAASLRRQGRQAAFEGRSARSCPYDILQTEHRVEWFEGFKGGR